MKSRIVQVTASRASRAVAHLQALVLVLLLGMAAADARAQSSPFIDETLPVSAQAGSSAVTLTIKGIGFLSSSVVYWQTGVTRTPLPTQFVSSTQLAAQVSSALLTTQQTAEVTVQNPKAVSADNVSNSQAFPVTLASGVPSFDTWPTYNAVGSYALSEVTGDFNGDGNQDVAVNSSGILTIFLGKGDGSFTLSSSLPVGNFIESVTTGDFNGDGKLDLAAVGENTINVFLGNGNGTFTATAPITVGDPDSTLYGLKAVDLNGDGKLDLLAIQDVDAGYKEQLYTLIGLGNGTFFLANTLQLNATAYTYVAGALSIGDFDGNGTMDAAVLMGETGEPFSAEVLILLNNGQGSFSPASTVTTQDIQAAQLQTTSLAVGDFNNDGKLDFAVSGCGTQPTTCSSITTGIYLGNGNGTFTGGTLYPAGGRSMQAADINGDGYLDLAFATANGVSFLLGNGDGTFNTNLPPYAVGSVASIAVADFNNDGRLDVAAASMSNNDLWTVEQVDPLLLATPSTVNFGRVDVGVSVEVPVTVTNLTNGTVPLMSVAITAPGNDTAVFRLVNGCPSSLAAGASCEIDVYFQPFLPHTNPAPTKTATLSVAYNYAGDALLVPLTGIAIGTVGPTPPPICHGTTCE